MPRNKTKRTKVDSALAHSEVGNLLNSQTNYTLNSSKDFPELSTGSALQEENQAQNAAVNQNSVSYSKILQKSSRPPESPANEVNTARSESRETRKVARTRSRIAWVGQELVSAQSSSSFYQENGESIEVSQQLPFSLSTAHAYPTLSLESTFLTMASDYLECTECADEGAAFQLVRASKQRVRPQSVRSKTRTSLLFTDDQEKLDRVTDATNASTSRNYLQAVVGESNKAHKENQQGESKTPFNTQGLTKGFYSPGNPPRTPLSPLNSVTISSPIPVTAAPHTVQREGALLPPSLVEENPPALLGKSKKHQSNQEYMPPRTPRVSRTSRSASLGSSALLGPMQAPTPPSGNNKALRRLEPAQASSEDKTPVFEREFFDLTSGLTPYFDKRQETLQAISNQCQQLLSSIGARGMSEFLGMPVASIVSYLRTSARQIKNMCEQINKESVEARAFTPKSVGVYREAARELRIKYKDVHVEETLGINNFARPCESAKNSYDNIGGLLLTDAEKAGQNNLALTTQRYKILKQKAPVLLENLEDFVRGFAHAMRTQCCLRVSQAAQLPLAFTRASFQVPKKGQTLSFYQAAPTQAFLVSDNIDNIKEGQKLYYAIGRRFEDSIFRLFDTLKALAAMPCVQISIFQIRSFQDSDVHDLVVVVTMNTPNTIKPPQNGMDKRFFSQKQEYQIAVESMQQFSAELTALQKTSGTSKPIVSVEIFTDVGVGKPSLNFGGRTMHAEMQAVLSKLTLQEAIPFLNSPNPSDKMSSHIKPQR